MKLIKINTDHYIIVDDSEIKEGDWMWREKDGIIFVTSNFFWDFGVPYKKITHSNIGHLYQDSILPLSLQEVKELIGEVDVEKRAETLSIKQNGVEHWDWQNGFKVGYNQALEDNKGKKYTEEDIRKAILMARVRIENVSPKYSIDEIFQSLQPKTEWEVEFIDGKLKLK